MVFRVSPDSLYLTPSTEERFGSAIEAKMSMKRKDFGHFAAQKSFSGIETSASALKSYGEVERLKEIDHWQHWGPYLSERQWGTVREDYSRDGDCWNFISHKDACSRVYRHGEDGLFGLSDIKCKLCVALAFWNGQDKILKERLFGLTGSQGNHGEDVKELYYYLSNVPSHSYMKAQYKYPQEEFPYRRLLDENCIRGMEQPEFEILDTGVFEDGRYWDIFMEYGKESPYSILCKCSVHNNHCEAADLHILPHVWLRNTWSHNSCKNCHTDKRPQIQQLTNTSVQVTYDEGIYLVEFDTDSEGKKPTLIFTENEDATTNSKARKSSKDAFHHYIVEGDKFAVNQNSTGTKCAAHYHVEVPANGSVCIKFCLHPKSKVARCANFNQDFVNIMHCRRREARSFYSQLLPTITDDERNVASQAYAGLLWNKQFYCYDVKTWFKAEMTTAAASSEVKAAASTSRRNSEWQHMENCDVISVPDKWEFPWYAAWDSAFHMVTFSNIDVKFAKSQLLLFLSDKYLHPCAQIPAYEFDFSDTNPPVHAWACLTVYRNSGATDFTFLRKSFHRLLLNFTWWANNTKSASSQYLYSGGFLGMDNVSVFDRSSGVPKDCHLVQADGSGWMAFYALQMLDMALELSAFDDIYVDLAIKFLHHFMLIAKTMASSFSKGGLWDNDDNFFFDLLVSNSGKSKVPIRIRSLVGLVPLFACLVLSQDAVVGLPKFWNILKPLISETGQVILIRNKILLSVVTRKQIKKIMAYIVDEKEFFSPFGIRSLSKYHKVHPFVVELRSHEKSLEANDDDGGESESLMKKKLQTEERNLIFSEYCPGESTLAMYGGNSNWRGPIWLCMNYLLVEALEKYSSVFCNNLHVQLGLNRYATLQNVAQRIMKHILSLFLPNKDGHRPLHGGSWQYAQLPNWKNLVLFYEYFHADTGRGCGASHQTGWTALVVDFMRKTIAPSQVSSTTIM